MSAKFPSEVADSTGVRITSKKHRAMIGIALGLAGVTAVTLWPQHAAPIEMGLYTMMILVPLALGLWADRHRRGFWIGVLLILVLHGFWLYFARTMFPFRTILLAISMALVEFTAMSIFMLKLLDGDVESNNEESSSRTE